MLLVDDLLLFPIRGLLWVFREIHQAAEQDLAGQAESMRQQLAQLYMMLETARISEEEFAAREKEVLARLDALEREGSDDESEQETIGETRERR